MKLKLALKLFV